jgi:hypothetical protein
METFDNLIPALATVNYHKENNAAKDEGVVSYSNAHLGFPAIVDLNHDTGDVIFTYGQSQIMPIKLERLKITDANEHVDFVLDELNAFNHLARAIVGTLSFIDAQRPNR